jgi:tape measure domain-containing protein
MTDKRIRIILDSKGAKRNADELNQSVKGIGKASDTAQFAVNKLASAISAYVSAASAVSAIKAISTIGDEYLKITGLLKLATDSQEEFNSALEESKRVAEATRAPLSATVETFAALNRVTDGLGKSQSELFRILETINKSIALTSPNAQSAAAALTQFGQALSGDFKAGSQELNSILEQTPGLADAVAKGLGVPTKALKQMGEEGKLSTELVLTGLEAVASEIDAKFAEVPKSVSSTLQLIRNDLLETLGDANVAQPVIGSLEDLREVLKDPAVTEGLTTISSGLIKLVEWGAKLTAEFADLGKGIGYFFASITGNVSEIDELEKQLKDLDKAATDSFMNRDLSYLFMSQEDIKREREDIKGQIDQWYKAHGIYVQTEEEKKKIAEDKKNTDEAEIKRQEEIAKKEVERLKALAEEKKREEEIVKAREKKQESIDSEIAKLQQFAAVSGQSKEVEIRYRLTILGASVAEIEKAAAIAAKIDAEERAKLSEESNRAVNSSKEVTKSLQEELALRRQIAEIYRSNELDADASFYDQQLAQIRIREAEDLAIAQARATEESAQREERLAATLENEKLTQEARLALRAEFDAQEKTAAQILEEEKTRIAEEGKIAREELERAEWQARLDNFGALGDSLMALGQGQSKKIFKIGQTLALAQAAVSLPAAVMESFKNGGGYPWGLAPAAAMAATGLKNIQQIRSAGSGLGGGGGGSVPAPSLGGGAGGGQPSIPTTASTQQVEQRRVYELRGVAGNDKITVDQFRELMEQDGAVVVLSDSVNDANRRNVIGVTAR